MPQSEYFVYWSAPFWKSLHASPASRVAVVKVTLGDVVK